MMCLTLSGSVAPRVAHAVDLRLEHRPALRHVDRPAGDRDDEDRVDLGVLAEVAGQLRDPVLALRERRLGELLRGLGERAARAGDRHAVPAVLVGDVVQRHAPVPGVAVADERDRLGGLVGRHPEVALAQPVLAMEALAGRVVLGLRQHRRRHDLGAQRRVRRTALGVARGGTEARRRGSSTTFAAARSALRICASHVRGAADEHTRHERHRRDAAGERHPRLRGQPGAAPHGVLDEHLRDPAAAGS